VGITRVHTLADPPPTRYVSVGGVGITRVHTLADPPPTVVSVWLPHRALPAVSVIALGRRVGITRVNVVLHSQHYTLADPGRHALLFG
jgi:hypothetical protein